MTRAESQDRFAELTDRQRDVLRMIASGRTNPEIATALGISIDGAKWHVSEILSKLGVANREEAAEYWRRRDAVRSRLARGFTALRTGPLTKRILIGGASAGIVVAGLFLSGGAGYWRGNETVRALVFQIDSPSGEHHLMAVSASDGRELSSIAIPDQSMRAAGRFVVIVRPSELRLMLPDGADERLLYSPDEDKVIVGVYPSHDGEMIAVLERIETGGAEVVTLLELETTKTVARYEQQGPAFQAAVGGFRHVWWHRDDRSVTIGTGGSLAFISPDGIRVTTVPSPAAVSPYGERAVGGLPATPGCVGFVATHQLDLVDLATGRAINSVREPEKGLKPVGWIVPGMGPMYTLESDAGCRPADAATTWWELPDSGEPIRQVQDPYELQRASRPSVLIEVQCGSLPRTPWGDNIGAHDLSGSGGGCKPISSPPGYVPEPANEHGWLYVGGRQVAEIARFTLIGEVEIGN